MIVGTLFLLGFGMLALNFLGYPLALTWLAAHRRRETVKPAHGARGSTVILPVYNEAERLDEKLANLVSLRRPERVRVLAVDGRSSDRSAEILEAFARSHPEWRIEVIQAKERGKIPQINEALARIDRDEIVFITDADARIENPEALLLVSQWLERDAGLGVVGGWVQPDPGGCSPAEFSGWVRENRMRYREELAGTSSIVVAPFYGFRRDLVDRLPRNCVADDVYVSFTAHGKGMRVYYAPEIRVTEMRGPVSYWQLYRHKLRKANGFSSEVHRFLPKLGSFSPCARFLLAVKAIQFFLLPWAAGLAGVTGLVLCLTGRGFAVLMAGFTVVGLGRVLARALPAVPSGSAIPRSAGIGKLVYLAVAFASLLTNLVFFPFWKQGSSYARVLGRRRGPASDERKTGRG